MNMTTSIDQPAGVANERTQKPPRKVKRVYLVVYSVFVIAAFAIVIIQPPLFQNTEPLFIVIGGLLLGSVIGRIAQNIMENLSG